MMEESGAEIGDRVIVDGRQGRLMPKPSSGDPGTLILKLDSGYNIGVEPEEIELVEKKSDDEDVESRSIEHSDDRPDVLVLHTGGTIASRVSYEEGGVMPAFDPEDLVEMYPELAEEVNIHSEVVAQMLSEDMEPGHWQQVAERIHEEKEEYDGIIVGHGTDTMAYTGAALTLMLQNLDIGVLLVGSQRSSDRPSTDAAMNMYCAGNFLKKSEFTGVGVCMHSGTDDDRCSVLPAAKCRKMHTSRRDAFEAVNAEPIGTVDYRTGEVEAEAREEEGEYRFRPELDRDVGVFKSKPGSDPEELEFLVEQDYSGVVIEGTGLGHMPVNSFDERTESHEEILGKLEELADGAVVAMSSHCINGRVDMDVYDAGLKIQEAGVIGAEEMHPELAYVKLMWSLGNSESMDEAEELFKTDVNGEMNPRTGYDG